MHSFAIQRLGIDSLKRDNLKFLSWRPSKALFEQIPPRYVQHVWLTCAWAAMKRPAQRVGIGVCRAAALLPGHSFMFHPGADGFDER